MSSDKKINYIELPAVDLDAVESFYHDAFGWAFVDYGPTYRAFNDGKMDGGFYLSDLRSTTESGAALVVLYAEELKETYDLVVKLGGRICKEIFSFPGGRRFHFLDPSGNELAVWSDK